MLKLIVTLAATSLLCSCAGSKVYRGNESRNYAPFGNSPAEVDAYLKKHVDKKTLKKWDTHVSDDTVIVEFNGNGATAR